MIVPKKKKKLKEIEENNENYVVSQEFDKLSVLCKESLIAFRQGVENFSMKEMRRALVNIVEAPLENTVYKVDKQGVEQFPTHDEERIVKLGRAVKYWQFQMFFEQLKNPEKMEEIKTKVEEFNKEQIDKEVG